MKHTLIPTVGRRVTYNLDNENEFFEQFKRRSHTTLNKLQTNARDWLAIAQHHDLETQHLDWTSSPLVALSFRHSPSNR
ncbi:MAG: FRG domain-containing protein [Flavobacteriales bacterium]|nr:FRG domain-containing protein [Flavobacteriales bacterium]